MGSSIKALLISIRIVSVAIFLKLSVSFLMEIAIYQIPLIWSLLLSCLKPPYLYLLINAIILTIVASSRFHHSNRPHIQFNRPPQVDLPLDFAPAASPIPVPEDFGVLYSPAPVFDGDEAQFVDVKPVLVNGLEVDRALEDDDDEIKLSSTWNPPQRINSPEFLVPSSEKPLASTRFSHRKPLKDSPQGGNIRGWRVEKAKMPETLESAWKRITEDRHVPLTRDLRKSDTWENHGRHVDVADYARSATLRDRTSYEPPSAVSSSPGSGGKKLSKEASLSRDELNRRVEAFIDKFKEEMRLQRQESLNQ